MESFPLGHRFALRIPWVDAGEIQGGLLQISAFEGVNLLYVGFRSPHPAIIVHGQYDGSHFQEGVPLGVESGGFHVDDDWQEAAETPGHGMRWFVFVSHSSSGLGRL